MENVIDAPDRSRIDLVISRFAQAECSSAAGSLGALDADETLADLAKTLRVDAKTIGRLKNQHRAVTNLCTLVRERPARHAVRYPGPTRKSSASASAGERTRLHCRRSRPAVINHQ
jgi:hypothetical protein